MMNIETSIQANTVVLKIMGEIDTKTGSALSTKFKEILENELILHVILNLSEVPNITSAGIGKILKLFKSLNLRGGTIEIKGISQKLINLFKEIHLDRIIPIEAK